LREPEQSPALSRLTARKTVLKSISECCKLTSVLSQAIPGSDQADLEDIYPPFKQNAGPKGKWHVRPGSSPLADKLPDDSQPNLVDEPLPRREG
jgi:transcriptional accessory protein Tex/SPT6